MLLHTSKQERILLFGHACDNELYYSEDDTNDSFDKIIVEHPHVYHLRHHGSNHIGI